MTLQDLQRYINQRIYENEDREITGQILNDVLNKIAISTAELAENQINSNRIVSTSPPSGIATEGTEWIMIREDN